MSWYAYGTHKQHVVIMQVSEMLKLLVCLCFKQLLVPEQQASLGVRVWRKQTHMLVGNRCILIGKEEGGGAGQASAVKQSDSTPQVASWSGTEGMVDLSVAKCPQRQTYMLKSTERFFFVILRAKQVTSCRVISCLLPLFYIFHRDNI